MENVFKLSRRKASAKWQVRKRWPSDVAVILKGEFNASTGEEDRKLAQQRLPLIAAEYERRVAEARERVALVPRGELTEAEAHRMAADFYRQSLPAFVVRRPIDLLQQRDLLKDTRERLQTMKAMLGRNDFGPVLAAAKTLTRQAGLTLEDDSPSSLNLHRMLMRAFVELHEAAVAALSGDADYSPRDSLLRDAPVPDTAPPGRTMADLMTAYEADKSPRWSGSSKKAVIPVFRLLRELFAERGVGTITREDARGVVALLETVPTNMGKRKELVGLTVRQAAEKAKKMGLPTLSPKTINDGYLLHIASMFNWARKEQWVTSSPFEGLSVHDPVADEDRRDPFKVDQLRTLFRSGVWAGPWGPSRDKAGAFWVPLLCLFHGLRNGEAAGLRVADIEEEDGVPVIQVRPYGDNRLKTKESRGTLPIHPELLRMGFLAFVAERRASGEAQLFPEGTANSRGQFGAKLGERFSKHVKSLGLEGRKLGMHSFRHNFEDRLRAAELPERTALALARRTEAGSSRIYGDGLSSRQKADAIARLNYPGLDLSHLYAREGVPI